VRHAGQPAQEIWTGRLQDLDQDRIDMSTIVLVGGPRTVLANGALVDRRGYGEKYGFGGGQGGRP
jgi:cobalt-precorrin 5A hydrolase/precorrin-3B C17-methyltransferase